MPPAFGPPAVLRAMSARAPRAGSSAARPGARAAARASFDPSVYVVTDRAVAGARGVEAAVAAALRGDGRGNRATMVQLREKQGSHVEAEALGRALLRLARAHGASLIVNDDIELAEALGADGVHLGQGDSPAAAARPRVRILGVSAGTPAEAVQAIADGADYVGVGSVFATRSKADAGAPIGVEGLRAVVEAVNGRIPVVAIGGVGIGNAKSCAEVGAEGVAVISSVLGADEPGDAAAGLAREVRDGRTIFVGNGGTDT